MLNDLEDKVLATVLLVSYNHEKYIERSLNCILSQKTNFKFNIVVADDFSTDGTLEIIKNYQSKYPEMINVLDTTKNYGITKNYQRAFDSINNCDYVAVFEGDDEWIDQYRLQKHVDFLDQNDNCSMVFNQYRVHVIEDERNWIQPFSSNQPFEFIDIETLINDNIIGNFSTCTYRLANLKRIKSELFDLVAYDWMINIYQAQFGKIGYLPQVMSVYYLHSGGTWSSKTREQQVHDLINIIDVYDKFYEHKYNSAFNLHKERLEKELSVGNIVKRNLKSRLKIIYNKLKKVI